MKMSHGTEMGEPWRFLNKQKNEEYFEEKTLKKNVFWALI